jgi:hypothetical protein
MFSDDEVEHKQNRLSTSWKKTISINQTIAKPFSSTLNNNENIETIANPPTKTISTITENL